MKVRFSIRDLLWLTLVVALAAAALYFVRTSISMVGFGCSVTALATFRREVVRAWLHAIKRRSQRYRMNWGRFSPIANRWVPAPKILYPYPNDRFYAKHPK